jgi:hypothetical protein
MTTTQFASNSRYTQTETTTIETRDGTTIVYLQRRFVPQPERFALLQEHLITEGDRLDNVTARYLGDPEQFWRVCDANRAMRPDDLMVIGAKLAITLPEGIPGAPLSGVLNA